MGNLLYSVGDYLLSNAIKRALTGAGLALASSQVLDVIVTNLLNQAVDHIQGGSSVAFAFISISGVGTALSIIASAIIARVTIVQAHLYITKM